MQADYSNSHDSDILLIQTDENGQELFRTKWGTEKHDFAKQIIKAPDNGYFIIGSTQSYGNGSFDILLLKLDDNFNELWHKTFGGRNFDYGMSIDISKDYEYLYICGSVFNQTTNSPDIFVLKTDVNGNEIWSHSFGGDKPDYGKSIIALENEGCIITGNSSSYSNNNKNVIVQKFDKNGNIEFFTKYEDIISAKLYPNPANKNQEINIEISPNNYDLNEYEINLYDIKGNLIKKSINNSSKWAFIAESFNSGIYFYQIIYSKETILTGKFIIY